MKKPLDWEGIWGGNIEILRLEDICKIETWNLILRGPVPFRTPHCKPQSPPVPGFPAGRFWNLVHLTPLSPLYLTPWKAWLSTRAPLLSSACACSVRSACFPCQPRAFRTHPNNLTPACSHHHTTPFILIWIWPSGVWIMGVMVCFWKRCWFHDGGYQ
jgi:hypothetical protein